jgi:GT2 family glycosyltransferase
VARRLRERLGPVPERAEWPPVSIVVLNRDGEEHLRRLLPLLASATDYPRLELVLVDNGSTDGSVDFARGAELPFPLTVLRNAENLSFSDANNDGVEAAGFDRLLLLNNDVEPFEPGWLKELVECLERSGAAAAGATLLHAENFRGASPAGYVLQHRGVELAQEAGRLIPLNVADGEDLASWEPVDALRPALTAACLLVRRDAFDLAGGFTTGFRWGWEDVDLGLKLESAGEALLCSGRSLLFHHTSSTRFRRGQEWRRSTRSHNQRLLYERWGPQLRREYLLDRFAGSGFWTDGRRPRFVVATSRRPAPDRAARELADAVEEEGFRVALVEPADGGWGRVPDDADFILLTDPSLAPELPQDLAYIAWVDEDVDAWVDAPLLRRAELTLVTHLRSARALEAAGVAPVLFQGAAEAGRLIGLLRERAQRLRFCLKLSRDWELEPAGLALRRGLERRGHACSLQLADEWELLGGLAADVAVACGDPGAYHTRPAQINVLWAASEVRPTQCDQWDLVLVPGEEAAATLASETPALVAALDPGSAADPAEQLLELTVRAAARDAIRSRVAAHA